MANCVGYSVRYVVAERRHQQLRRSCLYVSIHTHSNIINSCWYSLRKNEGNIDQELAGEVDERSVQKQEEDVID